MARDRVLVTGAAGFLGANIVRDLLAAGYPVRCFVRDPGAIGLKGIDTEVAIGDVRSEAAVRKALEGCRYLVHAAASYDLSAKAARETFAVNVSGTRRVMHAALDAGVERIVYTSSVAAIGPAAGRLANEDDHPTRHLLPGPYEQSKWIAERIVTDMVRTANLPATIVNPCTVIGAWDSRPTRTGRLLIDTARGRMPAFVDTGMNVIAAEDVAAGHRLALERGQPGRRYILGNQNLPLRDLLETIDAVALGKRARRVRVPHPVALAFAALDEYGWSRVRRRDPLAPVAGARLARRFMYYDPTRARTELGLPATPIEDAIDAAMRWFSIHDYL